MFLLLVSSLAVLGCIVLILFLKFASPEKAQHQQQIHSDVDALLFLRSVRSTKPFPISSGFGWKVLSISNGLRVWRRSLILENSSNRIDIIGCFIKLHGSVQVVGKLLRDASRFTEWRPGVESSTNDNGLYQKFGSVSYDSVTMVIVNKNLSLYSIVVEQQQIDRFWRREDNGCFWMLESSTSGLMFFILQPVEELDCCCLTLISHSTGPTTLQDSVTMISNLATSIKDYTLYRKMKVTPLLNIHIPQKIYTKTADPEIIDQTISLNGDLLESSPCSSSEEETDDSIYKKFVGLNPKEKSKVLEKSNVILRTRSRSQRLRSHSYTNIEENKTSAVKQRSSTLPKDQRSSQTEQTHDTKTVNISSDSKTSLDDVFLDNSQSSNDLPSCDKSPNTQAAVITSVPCIDEQQQSVLSGTTADNKENLMPGDKRNGSKNGSSDENVNKTDKVTGNDIRYITLANQNAADLLGEYFMVSNIDLKKPTTQQSALSGGWSFCGLENDVVIMKKTPAEGSNIISYMGKGLIHASPQTVLETVKNPRTKFTYDETLKKVDILNDVASNIKIVYFYHEVINMFKKSCFDFCVLQTERQDGDKYVLAQSSVESGLPVPVGVQRSQMYPSGWVIEPVSMDRKISSMATFIIQVDFGSYKTSSDKPPEEDVIAKQALSIAFLRQFLRPAKWLSRQQSSPTPKQQSPSKPKKQPLNGSKSQDTLVSKPKPGLIS